MLVLLCSCANPSTPKVVSLPSDTEEKAVVSNTEVSLKISGMVCQMGCAAAIEKKLDALTGIAMSSVNFEKESAVITFDSSIVNADDIIDAIHKTGTGNYQVTGHTTTLLQ